MQFFPDASSGEDPPFGVPLSYWLKEENKSVKIDIVDAAGDTVRTMETAGKPGINRIWWDYRTDPLDSMKLRTKPVGAAWVALNNNRTRPLPSLILANTYLVGPGTYQAVLSVNDKIHAATFEVLKDPNSEGSEEDIEEQITWMKKIRKDMTTVTNWMNQSELVRRQLYDLRDILKAKGDHEEAVEKIEAYAQEILDLELKLVQLKATGRGQDFVRWPVQLFGKLNYLAATIQTADFPPNDSHKQVYEKLKSDMNGYQETYDQLMGPKYDELLNQLKGAQVELIVK